LGTANDKAMSNYVQPPEDCRLFNFELPNFHLFWQNSQHQLNNDVNVICFCKQ